MDSFGGLPIVVDEDAPPGGYVLSSPIVVPYGDPPEGGRIVTPTEGDIVDLLSPRERAEHDHRLRHPGWYLNEGAEKSIEEIGDMKMRVHQIPDTRRSTKGEFKEPVKVWVSEDQMNDLDLLTTHFKCNRSALIRFLIDRGIEDFQEPIEQLKAS